MRLVIMTEDLSKTVIRPDYQRPLNEDRVSSIVANLDSRAFIAPGILCERGNDNSIADGHHRFAAWEIRHWSWPCIILGKGEYDELKTFQINNAWMVKVPASHLFKNSRDRLPTQVQSIVSETGLDYSPVMGFISGGAKRAVLRHNELAEREVEIARKALPVWAGVCGIKKQVNARRNAVIKAVGRVVCESKNPERAMKFIARMDFGRSSRFERVPGNSYRVVKLFADIISRQLAQNV